MLPGGAFSAILRLRHDPNLNVPPAPVQSVRPLSSLLPRRRFGRVPRRSPPIA